MRKTVLALLLLGMIGGIGWFFLEQEQDETFEQIVRARVTKHVAEQYGKETIVAVRSAYDKTASTKEARHQIAVQLNTDPRGEYQVFRLAKQQVVFIGRTRSLPERE